MRRAIAVYIEPTSALVHQARALLLSLEASGDGATDLVLFGPEVALARVPDSPCLVKVPQAPYADAAGLPRYRYINSLACLFAEGSSALDGYDYVLKSDADCFIAPGWSRFGGPGMIVGRGAYSHSDDVRARCLALAARFGLRHHGRHDLGSTLHGPTPLVREVCRLATEVTEWLVRVEFATDKGTWPGWWSGVASMYATEVALNHLAPDLEGPSPQLDFQSTSDAPTSSAAHIHCWHTERCYSKFAFDRGEYDAVDPSTLDLGIVRDYCLALALRARPA